MSSIINDFKAAQASMNGPMLATCLVPSGSYQDPDRLRTFANLSNHQTVSADMRHYLVQNRSPGVKLTKAEGNAWVDIFVSLWSTAREIVAVMDGSSDAKWTKAFDAYKDLANSLIRAYTPNAGGFQAWTVPCLYTVGKYLRLFAMRADAELKNLDNISFENGFQDDIMGNVGKNERLEQAAWVINRMFTICLNDRYVVNERQACPTRARLMHIYQVSD